MMKQRIKSYVSIVIIVGFLIYGIYDIYNIISGKYISDSMYIYIAIIIRVLFLGWMIFDFKRSRDKYEYQTFQKEIADKARKEKAELEKKEY